MPSIPITIPSRETIDVTSSDHALPISIDGHVISTPLAGLQAALRDWPGPPTTPDDIAQAMADFIQAEFAEHWQWYVERPADFGDWFFAVDRVDALCTTWRRLWVLREGYREKGTRGHAFRDRLHRFLREHPPGPVPQAVEPAPPVSLPSELQVCEMDPTAIYAAIMPGWLEPGQERYAAEVFLHNLPRRLLEHLRVWADDRVFATAPVSESLTWLLEQPLEVLRTRRGIITLSTLYHHSHRNRRLIQQWLSARTGLARAMGRKEVDLRIGKVHTQEPMSAKVYVPTLTCLRCDHQWVPRNPIVTICPRCKSRLWDKPKAKAGSRKK